MTSKDKNVVPDNIASFAEVAAIWRMKLCYETYADNEKLPALLREISWTNNLTIMSRAKTDDARDKGQG